jgi:transcriptional regulator with XRE-family HTH domain
LARHARDSLTVAETSLAERVGRRLRERRKALGLTLADVAREAAVSVSYLSAVEKGTNQPSLTLLARIVHALELTIADVLRAEGQNRLRREALDAEPGRSSLSHTGLQLEVASLVAAPGDSGRCPVSLSRRDVVVYVLAGELSVIVDDGEHRLSPGDALEARAPLAVSWITAGAEQVMAVWASVSSRDRSHA